MSAQHPAWRPAQRPPNRPRNIRQLVRTAAGQYPVSVRSTDGQRPSNAGECPAQCSQPRPVHDQSAVSPQPVRGRAISAQRPAQFSGNFRDVSAQLAGNVPPSAGECPRQSSHQSWHDGSQMTWQLPQQSAQHPGNHRATSEQCPSSWREISHTTQVNVRTMVRATVRR